MNIAVVKETYPGERRVALVPASVAPLLKIGCHVQIEAGAGVAAGYPDEAYCGHGAEIVADRGQLFQGADVVAQVRALGANPEAGQADLELVREGLAIVGMCDPLGNPQAVQTLAERGVTLFAMELIPRITRAQSMDVLSSMATISGYKAVLLAADHLPKMFPDVDDGRRHADRCQGIYHRRGRSRPAGDRHSPAARRDRPRVRRATGRQGTSRKPRREVRRDAARHGRCRRRGRLRQAARRGVLPETTRADGPGRRRQRRLHHDRRDPGQAIAAVDHGRRGPRHGTRLGDRRPGGGTGRQLRAYQGRRDGRG